MKVLPTIYFQCVHFTYDQRLRQLRIVNFDGSVLFLDEHEAVQLRDFLDENLCMPS